MKKLLILAFVLCASLAQAATWYATSSTTNINTVGLWVPTSTGSCTGSGTALTWPPAAGDVLDANGCNSITVNVADWTGTVTLQANATNGSGSAFTLTLTTCAGFTSATLNANIQGGKNTGLNITGTTSTCNLVGTITGGGVASTSAVTTNHSSGTLSITGNITGGTLSAAIGITVGAAGAVNITGILTPGSAADADALKSTSTGGVAVTGTVNGSATVDARGATATGSGAITITGSLINGNRGQATRGNIIWTPAATNYACYPKDSSYAIGTEDCTHTGGGAGLSAHAIEAVPSPAVTNVKSGVAYGSLTGTYAAGGSCVATRGGCFE